MEQVRRRIQRKPVILKSWIEFSTDFVSSIFACTTQLQTAAEQLHSSSVNTESFRGCPTCDKDSHNFKNYNSTNCLTCKYCFRVKIDNVRVYLHGNSQSFAQIKFNKRQSQAEEAAKEEAVGAPSLEPSKAGLDGALGSPSWCHIEWLSSGWQSCPWQGLELWGPFFQPKLFYDFWSTLWFRIKTFYTTFPLELRSPGISSTA